MAEQQTKVRIIDIANALGLSIGTVDRALHNRPEIKIETRDLVHAKARELGYTKNVVASALSRRPQNFAVILPKGDGFFKQLSIGIAKAAIEYHDFNVKTVVLECNPFACAEDNESAILAGMNENSYDGLILCPSNRGDVLESLKSLADKRIPVIAVASDIDPRLRIASVTVDSYVSGQIAADMMASALGGHGKVAVLPGFMSTQDHQNKVAGFRDTISESYPGIQFVGAFETNDIAQNAYWLTMDLLHGHPDLGGVYVATATGYGAAQAISEAGRSGLTKLVTTDLLPSLIPYLDDGTICATLWQDPVKQARLAVKLLYSYINGDSDKVNNMMVCPILLTKHNYRYYVDEQ